MFTCGCGLFWLSLLLRTRNEDDSSWLMGGNGKDIGYLLLGHICFLGLGLGQSRAVNKKHVVTNAAAVAHGRNPHKNKAGSFMIVVPNFHKDLTYKSPVWGPKCSMEERMCKFPGNSSDRRLVLTRLEPWGLAFTPFES